MFYDHVLWSTLALLFCSAMNINVYLEYSGKSKALQRSIAIFGIVGLTAGFLRFVMLSVEYNWWWLIVGMTTFLLSVGILSFLFRHKIRNVFGILNFILIPFFWWYGSRFNTTLSFEWFYSFVDIIRNLFA